MATTQEIIAATGGVLTDFTLEFRYYQTVDGSQLWRDYTQYLYGFGGIALEVEERAYPNAFRMTFGEIYLSNEDGFWNNLDVLDAFLVNTGEPYGRQIYKRRVRVSAKVKDPLGNFVTTIMAVALVEDFEKQYKSSIVTLKTISLDASSGDQRADGETAERHPLGSTSRSTPAIWTPAQPAEIDYTAQVAMYKWRQLTAEASTYDFGFFVNRRIKDVIIRTCWALDDRNYDVDDAAIPTFDLREVVSVRNVPPDDASICNPPGSGHDRTDWLVWNKARSCLVCFVNQTANAGNSIRIYDYDPVTNAYTLRYTMPSIDHEVIYADYIEEADSGGKDKRIVIITQDANTYGGDFQVRTKQAYAWAFDATGAGNYTVLANQISLGTDFFSGSHLFREGVNADFGQMHPDHGDNAGENLRLPFRQWWTYMVSGMFTHSRRDTEAPPGAIFQDASGYGSLSYPDSWLPPADVWQGARKASSTEDVGFKWTYGQRTAACISFHSSGGRLWFVVWDVTNKYRLGIFNLNNYSTTITYQTLNHASTLVPYHLMAPRKGGSNSSRVYCCAMEWKDTATDYSIGHVDYYDQTGAAWTHVDYLGSATGANQAWMVMELAQYESSGAKYVATMFNRETRKWRFVKDLGSSWSGTDANTVALIGSNKDNPNKIMGLYVHEGYSPDRVFFVEEGPHLLWSWNGTALAQENKAPGATVGDRINTDFSLGSNLVATPASYPDGNTPNGVLFGVSRNDFGMYAYDHPSGEYALWQYANYFSGFIPLLDVSELTFFELRTLLAEAYGCVHYYDFDGTFKFKKRAQSPANPTYTFSKANQNYYDARLVTMGYKAILNEVAVIPYEIEIVTETSSIIKTKSTAGQQSQTDGFLTDIEVSGNCLEEAKWQVVMVTSTTYDLYKLSGSGASATTPKKSAQSIDVPLRAPTDGTYLSIMPDNFRGVFVAGDTFTFYALPAVHRLKKLDQRDRVVVKNTTSRDDWKRAAVRGGDYDNRFVSKSLAPDYANNIMEWRKVPHPVVEVSAVFDPTFRPLQVCQLLDSGLGFDSSDYFQIMKVGQNDKRTASNLTLVKIQYP